MFAQTPERTVDPEKKSHLEERLLLAPQRDSVCSLSIDKLIAFINLIRSSSNGSVGIYRDILVTTVSEFIFHHACHCDITRHDYIFYVGGVFHVSLTLKPSFNLCPALPFGTSSSISFFADELDDVRSFLSK